MIKKNAVVLVVDDEIQNRKLLEAMLQPMLQPKGYQILGAANAQEALACIAEHPPALILLDILMPIMDGFEMARILKADPVSANIPIIMITALNDAHSRLEGLNAGAEDFLTKPVDRAELWLRVRNLLRLKELADLLLEHSQDLEKTVQARTGQLQLFRTAMDSAGDAIFLINRSRMCFIEVNQTACDLLGYTPEELLKQKPASLNATTVEQMEQLFDELITGQQTRGLAESQLQCKDGSRLPVEIHRHAQRYGKDWIIVSVARDITERKRNIEQLRATFESAIGALATVVEQRDPYTAGHQQRVAEIAIAIGRELGLDNDQLEGLRISALIHDIGKISVPAEILARPGKLSEAEFMIVKQHAQAGYDIVKGVNFPWPVAQTILQHHERLDGSGYPQGLKGDQIILEARILAVADVVEAMSSHRPYRAGLGIDAALAVLKQESGIKLDPRVVAAFEHLFWEKGFILPS